MSAYFSISHRLFVAALDQNSAAWEPVEEPAVPVLTRPADGGIGRAGFAGTHLPESLAGVLLANAMLNRRHPAAS